MNTPTPAPKPRGRPPQRREIPEWYRPINTRMGYVEEQQAPTIRHLVEVVAIAELLAKDCPAWLLVEVGELLARIDRLKVQCRAEWLAVHPEAPAPAGAEP